jgi:hypothetical protein
MSTPRWAARRLVLPAVIGVIAGFALWWLLPPLPRATVAVTDAGPNRCTRLSFSPDSRCLATYHWPKHDSVDPRVLCLWDVASGERVATLHRGSRQLESVAFSPDGRAVAARWFDRSIHVWNREDGRKNAEYHHAGLWHPSMQIVYSPEGRLLAYGPQPTSGQLWDVDNGNEVGSRFKHEVWETLHAGYEGFIVAFKGDRVRAWRLAAGQVSTFLVPKGGVRTGSFALTPDGQRLAAFDKSRPNEILTVWDSETQSEHSVQVPVGSDAPVFSPDGEVIAVTVTPQPMERAAILEWLIGLWNTGDRSAPHTNVQLFEVASGRALGSVNDGQVARFAPDGQTLAVAGAGGAVHLYAWPFETPWLRIVAGACLVAAITFCCSLLLRTLRPLGAIWGRT